MNPSKIIRSMYMAVAVLAAAFSIQTLQAQLIYSQDFSTDDSANWAVNYSDINGPANSLANFTFDYTTIGIPAAPHSTGGNTKGLKLSADYKTGGGLVGSAAVPGVSTSPTNFSITANFDMHVDMWINYNGAIPAPATLTTGGGGSSSSILYGCGYGTAGNTACVAGSTDAILVGSLTDNGSSSEMRMYGPSGLGQASYQNGVYQSTGTTTPGYPGEPFVYNNPTGTRAFYTQSTWNAVPSPNWTNFFPSIPVPVAQSAVYPNQQTNIQCNLGALAFNWHDVEVQKIGSVINYLIDGHLAASGNYSSAGTPAGPFLVFNAFDINSSSSTDPNFSNLNFVVFANIVVSNLSSVVNVSSPTPTTSEATPNLANAGVFTLTRSSTGSPLTVNYKLGGTATNGIQYSIVGATATSVTFAPGDLTTNIYIVPIDDGIPNLTTSVILSLQSGAGYAGAGNAVVSILDNDQVTIDINTNYTSQAYGRYTLAASDTGYNDFISYTLTRRGKLTTGSDLNVNLSYSGSAVSGTDFTPVSSVIIPDGTTTAGLQVVPLDNASVTTNRTVVVSVTGGTGYAIGNGPANGTVVSAHYAAPISTLLSDDLTTAADAANWKITYGCGDPQDDSTDFEVNFGMSLASAAGGITVPPPPGGNANALHVTCNKDVTPGSAGAVNVYYTNLWLTGDYAVRFSMNVIEAQTTANATEGVLFGIDHTGTCSNWWYGSGFLTNQTWSSDGIWYFVTAQPAGSAAGDYQEFTGAGGVVGGVVTNTGFTKLSSQTQTTYTNVYKDTPGPFTCLDGFGNQTPGVPANGSPAIGYDAGTWSDVEIRQTNNVVTMSINHTAIFVYTNTTTWKGGYLMLGYSDPYGTTIGDPEAGAYFANLQVVQLSPTKVAINSIVINGANVVLDFTTTGALDTASSFSLQSSGTVDGTYSDVAAAGTTSLGMNQFQVTTPYNGGTQFYRIHHN